MALRGIVKPIATRKYLENIQLHEKWGVHSFEVKNEHGLPLTLGVTIRGVMVLRLSLTQNPIATFNWSECEEMSYNGKVFIFSVCKLFFFSSLPPPPSNPLFLSFFLSLSLSLSLSFSLSLSLWVMGMYLLISVIYI